MTAQIRDRFVYNGKEYFLQEELLEQFFKAFPEKLPEFTGFMTALWRGYVADFEVRENQLYIKEIEWFSVKGSFSPDEFLAANFPGNKYTFFSGLVQIDEYRDKWNHQPDEHTIYEFLQFIRGDLVKHWQLNPADCQVFKELLMLELKQTAQYDALVQLWRGNNPDMPMEEIDKYIFNGIIRNVREFHL